MPTAARSFRLRAVRGPVALSAEVQREGFSRLLNLSGSGCLFDSERTHQAGDVVFMRIALPGQKEVETRGRVARVAPQARPAFGQGLSTFLSGAGRRPNEEFAAADERCFVGVAFEELDERDSELIARHVLRHR
jgi:hypothetical protein